MQNNQSNVPQEENLTPENSVLVEEENSKEKTAKKPNTALKIVVLVILVLLLVAGILLPIKLVPNAMTSIGATLSSFFRGGAKDERVTLSTNTSDIRSGTPFELAWDGKRRDKGSYSLTYPCTPGTRIETSVSQPKEIIPCDGAFYFSPNDNRIEITAYSESARYVDIPVTLSFLSESATEPDTLGVITLTVANDTVKPSAAPSPSKSPTAVRETPTAPTLPDLNVEVLNIGYIDSASGEFIPATLVPQGKQAAIKFLVVNSGGSATGAWKLKAELPSSSDPSFDSATQQSLKAGERIEFTLGFSGLNAYRNGVATIVVDPSNQVREASEANNKEDIDMGGADRGIASGVDFAVRVLNSSTNTSGVTTIRFEVENRGDRTTGSWQFRVTLPTTDNAPAYTSDVQTSLIGGEKAVYSVNFNNARSGDFTITIDPNNAIGESSESNNYATGSISR